jgi:uncharacterized protein YqgV (UPF0045/DUF77 family)
VLAAFSITPIATGESVDDLVAETVRIVRASGLPNETNIMFTNLEGEWDEIMAVMKACVDAMAQAAPRVSVVVKLNHCPAEPRPATRPSRQAGARRVGDPRRRVGATLLTHRPRSNRVPSPGERESARPTN